MAPLVAIFNSSVGIGEDIFPRQDSRMNFAAASDVTPRMFSSVQSSSGLARQSENDRKETKIPKRNFVTTTTPHYGNIRTSGPNFVGAFCHALQLKKSPPRAGVLPATINASIIGASMPRRPRQN